MENLDQPQEDQQDVGTSTETQEQDIHATDADARDTKLT